MIGEIFGMPIMHDSRTPKCSYCGNPSWLLPTNNPPICCFCNEPAVGKIREEIEIVRSLGDLRAKR